MQTNPLAAFLTPEMIRLRVAVPDWQSAVHAAGELLVEAEKCEQRYIEAMIEAVNEMGPYMVLAPGLALAHARPEDGVKEIGISFISLDPPVNFGSQANDPVSLVIAFGGVDNESHIDLLAQLARVLEDEGRREKLAFSSSKDEVIEILCSS